MVSPLLDIRMKFTATIIWCVLVCGIALAAQTGLHTAQRVPRTSPAPATTNVVLSWATWTARLQVQHATNLTGPWTCLTNISPLWPTNIIVPATNPVEFFRLAIIAP